MCFLPGFLALRMLRWKRPWAQTLFFAFGLSLLINHYLVILLAGLSIYTQGVLLLLFALECILLAYLFRAGFKSSFSDLSEKIFSIVQRLIAWLQSWQEDLRHKDAVQRFVSITRSALFFILLILSGSAVVWVLRVMVAYGGTVFNCEY